VTSGRSGEGTGRGGAIGSTIEVLAASTRGEMDATFARIATEERVQGFLVGSRLIALTSNRSYGRRRLRCAMAG
jgi:hypothetical protein